MNGKEVLSRTWEILPEIRYHTERIADLRAGAERMTALLHEVKTNGGNAFVASRLEEAITEAAAEEQKALEARFCMELTRLEISRTISRLRKGTSKLVLEKRYVQMKDWATIATEMDKSIENIYKIHSEACKLVTLLVNPGVKHGKALSAQGRNL